MRTSVKYFLWARLSWAWQCKKLLSIWFGALNARLNNDFYIFLKWLCKHYTTIWGEAWKIIASGNSRSYSYFYKGSCQQLAKRVFASWFNMEPVFVFTLYMSIYAFKLYYKIWQQTGLLLHKGNIFVFYYILLNLFAATCVDF